MLKTRMVSTASCSEIHEVTYPTRCKCRGDRFSSVDAGRAAGNDVLDPHPEATSDVDPGFDRERHARPERDPIAFDHVGVLVHFETDAMSRAMDELIPVSGGIDHSASLDRCPPRRPPVAPPHAPPPVCSLEHRKRLGHLGTGLSPRKRSS